MTVVNTWMKSLAVNDCLKSGAHGDHQILMICQGFTAVTFRCYLFVGLSACSFDFSYKKMLWWLISGDWLDPWRIMWRFDTFTRYQICSTWLKVNGEHSPKHTWCRVFWVLTCSFPSLSTHLCSSNHYDTSLFWFHLLNESNSWTWEYFLDAFWQILIWPSCSWMLPFVCTLF